MNADILLNLLKNEELLRDFPVLVETIKDSIYTGKKLTIHISENIYPSSHFLNIYLSRQKFLEKYREGTSFIYDKIINALQGWDGDVRSGYISFEGNTIAFFISGDLSKAIALFE